MPTASRVEESRAPRSRLSSREWRWLLGVTLFALAVRVVVVSAIGPRIGVFNDSTFYQQAGTTIAAGQGFRPFGLATAQWPPGWAFALSLLYRVTGSSDYAGQLLNAALGAATVAMLYLLVRRLFGHRAGLVAALALSVLPGALLPSHRIVTCYGNPLSKKMGILGEVEPQEMFRRFDAQLDAWRKADPATPVLPAFHLIAVVAQGEPGPTGKYRTIMRDALVETVYGWAKSKNAIMFIDIQCGKSDIRDLLPKFDAGAPREW